MLTDVLAHARILVPGDLAADTEWRSKTHAAVETAANEGGLAAEVGDLLKEVLADVEIVDDVAELRAAGETRPTVFDPDELVVICTGVPRSGRDAPDLDPPVRVPTRPIRKIPRRPEGAALRLPPGDPLRATFAPPAPEPEPSEPRRICVQIEQPTESNPGGTIAEGFERHTDSQVRVYDTDGNLLARANLRPGDDVEAAAKRLLREKHGAGRFYHPINYPRGSLH